MIEEYATAGCNRFNTFTLLPPNSQKLAFASAKAISLISLAAPPETASPLQKPAFEGGHTDLITCLTPISSTEACLASGSRDHCICTWQTKSPDSLDLVQKITAFPSGPVNCIASASGLIAASSSEPGVKVFEAFPLHQLTAYQQVPTGALLVTALAMHTFEGKCFLAVATADCKVNIWILQREGCFHCICLAGHEGWIGACDWTSTSEGLMLATASQDKYSRVWCIERVLAGPGDAKAFCNAQYFEVQSMKYKVALQAVLMGHDDWVLSVRWQQLASELLHGGNAPALITTSSDKSIIVWERCANDALESCCWKPSVHLGTLTGGNSMGIYGAILLEDMHIYANDYGGSVLHWTKCTGTSEWKEQPPVCTGHMRPVTSISWANSLPESSLLLSTSLDQTTRMHCRLHAPNGHWLEVARPQVHGYDIKCACFIAPAPGNAVRWAFVSGADEKCLRVFEGTTNFVRLFAHLSIAGVSEERVHELASGLTATGASVPALGLSNKNGENAECAFSLCAPPSENQLASGTLWPEVDKLYGHVFEIVSLATSPTAGLIASTSKSFKAEHSNVHLWNAHTLQPHQILDNIHNLTTTATSFSPSGTRLISVSRDRSIALYQSPTAGGQFTLTSHIQSAHSRIIWGCCWAGEDKFLTVSRDSSVKLWLIGNEGAIMNIAAFVHPEAVGMNSVDCFWNTSNSVVESGQQRFKIAIGLENGRILSARLINDESAIEVLGEWKAHSDAVNQIKWDCRGERLATCSNDHFVKIFK